MALPLPVIPPQPDAYHLAPHRIKRCTFRRLIDVEAGSDRSMTSSACSPTGRSRSRWATSNRRCRSATPARRRTSSAPTRTRDAGTLSSAADTRAPRPEAEVPDAIGPRLPSARGFRASARAVCKPSSVPIGASAPIGDGHPSEAVGRPTAHAADPRAGQRASPPAGCPARVAPSYLALLQVEFARFTPSLRPEGRATASSLWHWSSSRDGRVLPATLRWGARTFLTACRRVTPTGAARPSDRLADAADSTLGRAPRRPMLARVRADGDIDSAAAHRPVGVALASIRPTSGA